MALHVCTLILIYPLGEMGHPGVNSRDIAGASNSPSDKSNDSPPARLSLADKRTASVSCTGVLPHLASCTDLALAQAEPVATSSTLRVQSVLQLVVVAVVLNERKIHLVLDELERTVHLVLSPSSHPTPTPGSVVELVAKLVPTRWQASCVHIGLVEVDVAVGVKDGNVVAQSSCAELRVLEKPDKSVLLVLGSLWGVEATGIVLADTDLQELILLDILELVSSGDNLPGASSVVVAAVVGNDSTAADEVVVLVENEAGPGELAGARLAMLEATSRCWEAPCSALLARIHSPLVAAVSDTLELLCRRSRSNARAAKRRVVDRGIVTASLLSNGAGVDLRVGVGVGPVHNPQSKTVLCLLGLLGGLLPQRLQPGVNQAASNKVIVVGNVTAKRVATLFAEGNAAALAEAAGKLASAGNSAGRGLPTAALREGTALPAIAAALSWLFSGGGEAERGAKEAESGVHIFLWGLSWV